MTAIGITSGVGSMLIGAQQEGFKILGNVEWRNYYDTGTFEKNFNNAPYTRDYDDVDHLKDATIAFCHGDCGQYSILNNNSGGKHNPICHDTVQLVETLQKTTPRFFAIDNLPPQLVQADATWWHDMLPEYDVFFEWISNYNYGNIQKNRKRLFIIGAKKEEHFIFRPGEFEHSVSVMDTIEDLPLFDLPEVNHLHADPEAKSGFKTGVKPGEPSISYKDAAKEFLKHKTGYNLDYEASDGLMKKHIGKYRLHADTYSQVLSGGNPGYHPVTAMPLTTRERARIQGFPDDFIFVLTEKQETNTSGWKQTGKAMPIQFNTYFAKLVKHHIEDTDFDEITDVRIIKPNRYIDHAKQDYCAKFGYEHQEEVCSACWLRDTCIVLEDKQMEEVE